MLSSIIFLTQFADQKKKNAIRYRNIPLFGLFEMIWRPFTGFGVAVCIHAIKIIVFDTALRTVRRKLCGEH